MKRFLSICLWLSTLTMNIFPTTSNGRIVLSQVDDSTLNAKIQINTDTGTDDLGGATIVVRFDSTKYYYPSLPAGDTDYVFHNFNGGNYAAAFVTRPFVNELWINLELEMNNSGTLVSGSPSWSDIVTLQMRTFGIITSGLIEFNTTSPFWAIFDGNNSTPWSNGNFEGALFLPVELNSFTSEVKGNTVHLQWSTSTEVNNKGFELQRKIDFGEFTTIAFIKGFGTTNDTKNYTYSDANLLAAKYSYRLKQMDFDGSYKFSNELTLEVRLPQSYALTQNYPNPFNPSTKIGFSLPEDSHVKLIVYNILGEAVGELVNNKIAAGNHEFTFNSEKLPSGTYIYRLEANDNVIDSRKMILLR